MKVKIVSLLFCFNILFGAFAQEQQDESPTSPKPEISALEAKQTQSSNNANILKLEDTVRANKEQPQVLTIVPWQLPVHKTIESSTELNLSPNKLPVYDRKSFIEKFQLNQLPSN